MRTALLFLAVCVCAGLVKVFVPNDGGLGVLGANLALGVLVLLALRGALEF